jgi:glycosyltransferase involved in cell wall biosynthesis
VKVCYFGTYDTDQARTQVLLEGLRHQGVEVIECHAVLWPDTASKLALARNPFSVLKSARGLIKIYRTLLRNARLQLPYDAVIFGHPAQLDLVLTAWWFRRRQIPVIWDALVSMYDTVVTDRGVQHPRSIWAQLYRLLDRLASRVADVMVLDTAEHCVYWQQTFAVSAAKLIVIPVGATDLFTCVSQGAQPDADFTVLFYGTYIPLHGVETIIWAAKCLEQYRQIHWILIGTGQQRAMVDQLVKDSHIENAQFIDWVPLEKLPDYIAAAQVCLGVFGFGDKATRIVPNKVFQCLAAQRPVLTADTPAARALLWRDGLRGAQLVPAGNAESLAAAVLQLYQSPERCRQLAEVGFSIYKRYYSSQQIGQMLVELLSSVTTDATSHRWDTTR